MGLLAVRFHLSVRMLKGFEPLTPCLQSKCNAVPLCVGQFTRYLLAQGAPLSGAFGGMLPCLVVLWGIGRDKAIQSL